MAQLERSFALVFLATQALAHAQAPTPYCTAGTSTNGCVPSISANVQPNTISTAGCVITTTGLEGQRSALGFYGVDNTGFTPLPWAPNSSSFRCVKSPLQRLGAPVSTGGVDGACDGSLSVDWDAYQAAHPVGLGTPWSVGAQVFVQTWYRDPAAPGATHLSNALELTMATHGPTPCVTPLPGMVMIAPGTFWMGSAAPNTAPYFGGFQPVHQVTLTYCFWMAEHEVTQAQYVAVMGENPSFLQGPTRPVEYMTWNDANQYCAAINAQQAALGAVPPGYQYRLPTEAEWEYACRAGTTTEFSTGAELYCPQARIGYSDHSLSSCGAGLGSFPVGSYPPNPWGLYDMHGNVWELCLDSVATYPVGPVTDPFVTGGVIRVARGGSYVSHSHEARSTYRWGIGAGSSNRWIGFRVVLAPVRNP